MGKGKKPRKAPNPTPDPNPGAGEEMERQTQAKGELVPPSRRPPTAVGTDTPPPAREPVRLPQRRSPAPRRLALFEFFQTIRTAVGALLDIADAAAEAITKRLEGRA